MLKKKSFSTKDEQEFIELDNELQYFVKTATPNDLRFFRNICYGLEAFAMIASGIEYDRQNKS